jgi:hypothetical protein
MFRKFLAVYFDERPSGALSLLYFIGILGFLLWIFYFTI